MPTNEFHARIKELESRLDKAETLLESARLVLEKMEFAHEHPERVRRTSLVLAAASTSVTRAAALARRQESPRSLRDQV